MDAIVAVDDKDTEFVKKTQSYQTKGCCAMVSPIKSNSETNPWFDEVARPQETNSALEKERDALVEKFKCHETAVRKLVREFNKLEVQRPCPYCFGVNRIVGYMSVFEHDDTCEWYIFTKALAALEALYETT